ncbi:MAG: hypothetical protein CM1200mP20_07680 [Pseudomonadota bacterium]|nr:MAG: hypothetical protein CM1200mP20_07680 [Pseudomonadota bacterium]
MAGQSSLGHVDQARWVYVAETDAKAKEDSAAGLVHHIKNFMAKNAAGYLGTVSEKDQGGEFDYESWRQPPCCTGVQNGDPGASGTRAAPGITL